MVEKHGGGKKMNKIHKDESGATIIVVVVFISISMIFLALALDIGWILSTKAELQHAADASALAAIWGIPKDDVTPQELAQEYSAYHSAGLVNLVKPEGVDVTVGYMEDPLDIEDEIDSNSTEPPNSVEVTLRMHENQDQELDLFLGAFPVNLTARARAAISFQVFGFEEPPPPGEENPSPDTVSGMIPFSFSETLWDEGIENGNDEYMLDDNGNVVSGSDGKPELVIYPIRSTAGNWGTVDIGPSNNSTADIRRQIAYGVSQADLDAIDNDNSSNGLVLSDGFIDNNGNIVSKSHPEARPYKDLNGDTGISLGFKDAILGSNHFPGIIGLPRVILIHESVTGPGNNAEYRIVGFENVRIMAFNTRGANSELIVQPVLPDSSGNAGEGSFVGDGGVFSPDVPESDTLFLLALTR